MNPEDIRSRLQGVDFCLSVSKPNRYAGNEYNPCFKPKETSPAARFLLCYPDAYEVGISNLSIAILYGILNRHPRSEAQRAFAPWPDMEAFMKQNGIPLYSLETFTPADMFDVLGFTLQYELTYTNVLAMMRLSGLELEAEKRPGLPLVAAGGPCAFNPLPLAPFVDLFFIGDAEQTVVKFSDMLFEEKQRAAGFNKRLFLEKAASSIEGLYVPSIHGYGCGSAGAARSVPGSVLKCTVPELAGGFFTAQTVPSMQGIHSRISVEVMRGCPHACAFCQACVIYRPLRKTAPEAVYDCALGALRLTGFDEVSFLSLSVSDYPHINALMDRFMMENETKGVRLAVPSLRVDSIRRDILEKLSHIRHAGLTLAPEAGNERLRFRLNKKIQDTAFFEAVETAAELGWNLVKLYFMIGLPCETDEDVRSIAEFVQTACLRLRRKGLKAVRFNVSVSCFVPKPHTPLQWCAMEPLESLMKKIKDLKYLFKGIRQAKFTYSDPFQRVIEAAFARSGVQTARLLRAAFEAGARFDGWDEQFNYSIWEEAARCAGIDMDGLLGGRGTQDPLEWDFIQTHVPKENILKRYEEYLSL